MLQRRSSPYLFAIVLPSTLGAGCGTNSIATNDCQKIEYARCRHANECGRDLSRIPPSQQSQDPIAACMNYYQIACLHGMVIPSSPSVEQVKACLNEIEKGNCTAVLTPQDVPGCQWLTPPADGSTEKK
ncbi:hypothetical protein [Pajaroellobacter abortibovis]|uniref:Lipoprotein n=1 Tax=Pajaroellobacter abortibovis TaxID=1882918 RepID=A0A1L6MWV3_9BACT|nr:hypothetical protein [Pajaroellobacter abortibovis]APR99915.1 hypothetical protein BCY86_03890 [Pajaroellobacter abortibovis]